MLNLITPVGTSLLTNYRNKHKNFSDLISCFDDKSAEYIQDYTSEVKNLSSALFNFINDSAEKSAEICSITKIIKELKPEEYQIYLILTDSALSNICGLVIKEYYQNERIQTYSKKIDKLYIKDQHFIDEGLANLISYLNEIYNGYNLNYIFNITGGFKGVIPYLTLWSFINGIRVAYLFEESEILNIIPSIPIEINLNLFEENNEILEKISEGINKSKIDIIRENNLPEDFNTFLSEIKDDNKFLTSFSPIGGIYWNKYNNYYKVSIPDGFYHNDPTKDGQLNDSIQELLSKLSSTDNYYNSQDNDLKHHIYPDNSAIFCYRKKPLQIRLHYMYNKEDWEKGKLTIFNNVFKQSSDEEYAKNFAD